MSIVEMRQTEADHPGADEDLSRPRNEQVPELRDGTSERERDSRDGAHEDSRERTARSA